MGLQSPAGAEPGRAVEDGPTVVFDRTVELDRDAEIDQTIELDRPAGDDTAVEPGATVELDMEAERMDDDVAVGLDREPAQPAAPVEGEEQMGITRPSRRGSS